MPAQQGVLHWPSDGQGLVTLCDETEIPLPDVSVDRVLLVHGLECSEQLRPMLREIWRVLAPGGRVLIIVPNRSGLWARRDATPFGYGRPYSLGQLETQLKRHRFLVERHLAALYAPPSQKRFWLKAAPVWEKFGQKVSGHLASGVLMIEASKQVYAPTQRGRAVKVSSPMRVLGGIGKPAPEPASTRAGSKVGFE